MYTTTHQPNSRLHIADALRGIAILGIILVHNVEHMNFYLFPEVSQPWLVFLNKVVWDGVFFAFGGKMYSIFALMFGLSFFIQNDNQQQKGRDFTWRFEWRMVLLFAFGMLNTFFFNGDILVAYAVTGLLMPFIGRLSTKMVVALTIVLLIQPMEIYQFCAALLNPNYQLINVNSGQYFQKMMEMQRDGSFWECGWASLKYGQLSTITWNIESGRITQLPGLFCLGMLLGRLRLFYNENDNLKSWLGVLAISLLVFFPVYGMYTLLPEYITRNEILLPLQSLLKSWTNLSQMFMYVSVLVLLFYSTRLMHNILTGLAGFGRASMTNYFLQSALGSLLYYGWGFGLYRYCGPAVSLLIGIGMVYVQYIFCRWWMKTHSHGPMEGLWKKLTWLGIG